MPEQHTIASDPPVKGKFALFEFIAASSARLTKSEVRVLMALALRANATTWSCCPRQIMIASDIGESNPEKTGREKVRVAVSGLRRKGMITTSRVHGGASLTYTICQPRPDHAPVRER